MSEVIIFGLEDTAELAAYYLRTDSNHDVVAFTVHEEYCTKKEFMGLPVIPFENLEFDWPPNRYKLFAPMTGKKMNKIRKMIFDQGKQKGYEFISYVSSKASVFDNEIGENCFILEDNTIQPFTKIGNNVVLWSGNHIGHHSQIDDHVFFTSHVVLSGHCHVKSFCFFGVNSTIRDFSIIEEGTLLAMGASLTKQKTESWRVYVGSPAKKLGDKPSHSIY